jgi:hypothetical protein
MDALKLLKEEAARKRKVLSDNGIKVSLVPLIYSLKAQL